MNITVDPITYEVVRNRVDATLREMEAITIRTSRSSVIYSGRDFSCAIMDHVPTLIGIGAGSLNHIFPMTWHARSVLSRFASDVAEGDIFIGNDPYDGGTHLNDVLVFIPMVYQGALVGFAANRAHYSDVGGMVPGSISGAAREIYQEGLRIPPIRLGRNGQFDRNVLDLILRNVRLPDEALGDLSAQMASCRVAERRILELMDRYGADVIRAVWTEMLDASERHIRQLIGELPQRTVSHESYLDNDGVNPAHRRIRVRITVAGDRLLVDYTGTSAQSAGPANITEALANGYAFIGVKAALDPQGAINGGVFRAISVLAPEGSMMNARPPAAAAGTGEVGQSAIAPMIALSNVVPERVSAEDSASANHAYISGQDARRGIVKRFIYYDYPSKGAGARSCKDGVDAIRDIRGGYVTAQSIEVLEQRFPVLFRRYAFRTDSGGAGRYRGGLGVVREYETLVDGIFSMLSETAIVPLSGLYGGHGGTPARWELVRGGRVSFLSEELRGKCAPMPVRRGDVIRISSQGGGGWGDPLERSLDAMLDDVRNGKVSHQTAREVYGVVIDGDSVEVEASRETRAWLADARVHLRPVRSDAAVWEWGVRVIRVGPRGFRAAADGDFVEVFVSERPNPLRAIVRLDPTMPEDVLLLDAEAWDDMGLTDQSRLLFRRVDSYAGGGDYPARGYRHNPVAPR
jgi:N-methylhydantoinase B